MSVLRSVFVFFDGYLWSNCSEGNNLQNAGCTKTVGSCSELIG